MRRTMISLGMVLAAGGGAAAWWLLRPPPPPPPKPIEEQKFTDVDRAEYEKWMQSLGYTD